MSSKESDNKFNLNNDALEMDIEDCTQRIDFTRVRRDKLN